MELFKKNLIKVDSIITIFKSFDMNLIDGIGDGVNPQRLLQVDNRLVVPIGVPLRFLFTSSDVLHC
jgi:heme/copper-type cytochrome/quinol oxidase subunit 2